jgi:hypothetical protein
MIEQSSSRYKEELQYSINPAFSFNENFISTIIFALTSLQSLMVTIDDPRSDQIRESQDNIIIFTVNEFKTQIKELKMSINEFETDEFPQKLKESQNAIITNMETQLVNKVMKKLAN